MAYRSLRCECGQKMRVGVDMLGKKGQCPSCRLELTITEENAPIREENGTSGPSGFPHNQTSQSSTGTYRDMDGAIPSSGGQYHSSAESYSSGRNVSSENIQNVIIVLAIVIACMIPIVNFLVFLALLSACVRPNTRFKLVLRRFHASDIPIGGQYVLIVGRKSGIIDWLFTMLGLSDEFAFRVTERAVEISTTSFSGKVHTHIPLTKIASSSCGYQKSVPALLFGSMLTGFAFSSLLAALGIINWSIGSSESIGLMLVSALASVFCFVYFVLNKELILTVESAGGLSTGLLFKPSVIENISVDMAQAQRITDIINEAMVKSQNRA